MDLIDEKTVSLEALTQCKYEIKKLKDEVDILQRTNLALEENVNLLTISINQKNISLKKSEKLINSLHQTIKGKDQILDVLNQKLQQETGDNKKLKTSNATLENRIEEKSDFFNEREKELTNKHEKECFEFKQKIKTLKEEYSSKFALFCELYHQLKILDDEKRTIQEKIEFLLNDEFEKRSPLYKGPPQILGRHQISMSPVQRRLNFSPQGDANPNNSDGECNPFNLQEELFLAEIDEKQNKIKFLEEQLLKSEMILHHKCSLIMGTLKEAIDIISVVWNNSETDFELVLLPLKSNFEKLLKELEIWLEGQTGESNPLTEAPDPTAAAEPVVSDQPATNRTVESVSIATQTDKNLLAKALEELSPIQNVPEHDFPDLDMDLYRSYRKLSILLEEEDDEALKRVPSNKNALNSKSFSAKSSHPQKTHSADDLLHFETNVGNHPNEKLVSSCANIILSGRENVSDEPTEPTEFFRSTSKPQFICDTLLSDTNKSEERSVNFCNEKRLGTLDQAEALRQPHSFDSYLDFNQMQNPLLLRQISDPTQSTVCDPPLFRRGSYLKRPRSTCRPLRLPCKNDDSKQESRVSKVRFDLSNSANSKSGEDNAKISKSSSLKNNRKIKRVSRFTVERVDEEEFRRSLDESNKTECKRPPLIHSVAYKKSALPNADEIYDSADSSEALMSRMSTTGSPDSPSYETATENSPVDSFDLATYESNYLVTDVYPSKRRKQSDSSSYSVESQESIDGNDILVKSIRLHTNSEYIIMKELDRESTASSRLSVDLDIPYIDAEELPVIKPSPEIIKTNFLNPDTPILGQGDEESDDGKQPHFESPICQSESCDTFLTACSDVTPISESSEALLSPPKSLGLSKSPTVLKNLANFELYNTVSESITGMNQSKRGSASEQNEVVQEEDEEEDEYEENREHLNKQEEEDDESTILKLTSSDASEMSDTVTYVTVKSEPSNMVLSSDCDSDTYVTIQSDKSTLERKFSDLSENSSSPYNTPPDTSSASFCTPPDTYSPILSRLARHFGSTFDIDSTRSQTLSSPKALEHDLYEDKRLVRTTDITQNYDTPTNASPLASPTRSLSLKINHYSLSREDSLSESESITIYNIDDSNFPSEGDDIRERKELIMFDSPKLEFYETNDSIENLEAFLKTEEGLQETRKYSVENYRLRRSSIPGDLSIEASERKNSDESQNSLESPSGTGDTKFFEKRNKRHPPLSRQNSTEDYNFLDPHDSSLNLSEEISSPSTTPDTSNKTVIFKNKPLTVSNTIDLDDDDDDFPISEAEIQINFNESETEIVEIEVGSLERHDIYSCRSEPCIPSISSSSDLPNIARLPKQSSSVTDDDPHPSKSDLPKIPPEIIVSNLSSESENDSDGACGILVDFASNVSDRSDVNMSDVNSISGQSDTACSSSDPSDNMDRSCEVQLTDVDASVSISPEVSDCSGSSHRTRSTDSDVAVADVTRESCHLNIDVPEILTEPNVGNLIVINLPDETSLHSEASVENVLSP